MEKPKELPYGHIERHIPVNSAIKPLIIGVGGEKLRRLEEETYTDIRITPDGFEVVGIPLDVDQAAKEILTTTAERPPIPLESYPKPESVPSEWLEAYQDLLESGVLLSSNKDQSVITKESKSDLRPPIYAQQREYVFKPKSSEDPQAVVTRQFALHGIRTPLNLLIGSNGTEVEKMMRETHTSIAYSGSGSGFCERTSNDPLVVTIYGYERNVQRATFQILDVVSSYAKGRKKLIVVNHEHEMLNEQIVKDLPDIIEAACRQAKVPFDSLEIAPYTKGTIVRATTEEHRYSLYRHFHRLVRKRKEATEVCKKLESQAATSQVHIDKPAPNAVRDGRIARISPVCDVFKSLVIDNGGATIQRITEDTNTEIASTSGGFRVTGAAADVARAEETIQSLIPDRPPIPRDGYPQPEPVPHEWLAGYENLVSAGVILRGANAESLSTAEGDPNAAATRQLVIDRDKAPRFLLIGPDGVEVDKMEKETRTLIDYSDRDGQGRHPQNPLVATVRGYDRNVKRAVLRILDIVRDYEEEKKDRIIVRYKKWKLNELTIRKFNEVVREACTHTSVPFESLQVVPIERGMLIRTTSEPHRDTLNHSFKEFVQRRGQLLMDRAEINALSLQIVEHQCEIAAKLRSSWQAKLRLEEIEDATRRRTVKRRQQQRRRRVEELDANVKRLKRELVAVQRRLRQNTAATAYANEANAQIDQKLALADAQLRLSVAMTEVAEAQKKYWTHLKDNPELAKCSKEDPQLMPG